MIAPHKYLDLDLSILNLGGIVLNIVMNEETLKYDELLSKVILARGDEAKEVFIQTLSFLFILGKIDYKQDIDTIEFLG